MTDEPNLNDFLLAETWTRPLSGEAGTLQFISAMNVCVNTDHSTLAQLPDINIKAEILGRKYVSSRCDWGSLTTKPSFSSVTELRAS